MTTTNRKTKLPLLHEVEIVYSAPFIPNPLPIKSSKDTYALLESVYDKRKINYKECFYVVVLNRANFCLGISKIGVGTTTGVAVNIKEIFQLALKSNASGIIISHNHPSNNLTPSENDNDLTRKVKHGCQLLDLQLLDHVIVTSTGYMSYADEGLL